MEDVEPPRAERLRQRQRGVRGSCMLGGAPARKREWEREQAGENERVRACRATTMEAEGRVRELLLLLVATRIESGRRGGGNMLTLLPGRRHSLSTATSREGYPFQRPYHLHGHGNSHDVQEHVVVPYVGPRHLERRFPRRPARARPACDGRTAHSASPGGRGPDGPALRRGLLRTPPCSALGPRRRRTPGGSSAARERGSAATARRGLAALRGVRRPPHMTTGMEVTRCGFGQLFVAIRMVGGQPKACRCYLHLLAADRRRPARRRKDGKMLLLLADGTENNR